MASEKRNAQFKKNILAIVLLTLLLSVLLPKPVFALEDPNSSTNLPTFIQSIRNGNAAILSGIYVSNVMAFPIIQQPMGYPGFVSNEANTLTQFSMANEVGNLGLLAHNHLAGTNFAQLIKGDVIVLVYGDGHTQSFRITEILQYQALSPNSPYSDFKDLATEKTLSVEQLFNKVYRGDFHVTLQTCIEQGGNPSWGRLFVIAQPILNTRVNNYGSTRIFMY